MKMMYYDVNDRLSYYLHKNKTYLLTYYLFRYKFDQNQQIFDKNRKKNCFKY